jgi:uncharacterized protein (TIGR02118 family)
MSVSYFVRYDGPFEDEKAFEDHYRRVHAEILSRWPKVKGLSMYLPMPWNDPLSINRADSALLVQIEFDSTADLAEALASPGRLEAREDFNNFPAFAGRVSHQAMRRERIF